MGGSKGEAAPKSCFVQGCTDPLFPRHKFCETHKRLYAAMTYQRASLPPEAQQAFDSLMKDPVSCGIELAKFQQDNPCLKKFARKKPLDVCRYLKVYSAQLSTGARSEDVEMTHHEFINWAQTVKALSRSGAESWWSELMQDKHVEKNQDGRWPDGRRGALQCVVPGAAKLRYNDESRSATNKVQDWNFRDAAHPRKKRKNKHTTLGTHCQFSCRAILYLPFGAAFLLCIPD